MNNEDNNPLKNTNAPTREQNDNQTNEADGKINALWLSREKRIRIDELISLITPHIKKGEAEQPWSELCDILLEQREKGKWKTLFYPGEIILKEKRTTKQKGEHYGKQFFLLRARVDGSDRREVDIWVLEDKLDNKESDWPIIQRVSVGERYEFEVQRWGKTDFHLRALIKL